MRRKCPICRKPISRKGLQSEGNIKWFPFCSERCKLIDLGKWFDADYVIPAEQLPKDEPKGNDGGGR